LIPKNINRVHILRALGEIDENGVPLGRESTKFQLFYNKKYYPPKYVMSLANKYANGVELDSSQFSGGLETNSFLGKLGFEIIEFSPSKVFVKSIPRRKISERKRPKHDERCPKCKKTIETMLRKIYGTVEANYKFDIGTKPEDYRDTPFYLRLQEIFSDLQNHRGHKDFVRSQTLPNCDFFVPSPGFIVEYDESQHFTACRKISFSKYPENLKLGFEREKWIRLCETINAKDNDPRYRDEQRAWYDTLRDFIPVTCGLEPTIRIFSQDFRWCSLNPEIPSDVGTFRNLLEGKNEEWTIEVKEDPNPSLARIIIAGNWSGNVDVARKLLESICEVWPAGKKVNFLITCGGFITFNWPSSLSNSDIENKRFPKQEAINFLAKEARKNVELLLNRQLWQKLKERSRYITIGVDSYKTKVSVTQNYITQPHIELVFLIDLENGIYHWTGKSYPTPNQEKGLVRISDLLTHFFDSDLGKVMLLGCHDLTIFNPRSNATAKGWRKNMKDEFKNSAKKEEPMVILQHPHTTDSTKIWFAAWNSVEKLLPSIKEYASAGRYFNEGKPCRSELIEVLAKTKYGNAIDFIAWVKRLS